MITNISLEAATSIFRKNGPLVNVSDHLPDYTQCCYPQDQNLHIVFSN